MKRLAYILLLLPLSCREKEVAPDSLLSFTVEGEEALINQEERSVAVKLGENAVWKSLKIDFITQQGQGILEINGNPITAGTIQDLSEVREITLKSGNGTTRSYTLKKSSVFEDFGMGMIQERFKSLNRSYSFYFDQFGTGLHQYINCGPTSVTMALAWSDSTFKRTPQEARQAIRPEGGWWYTNDIYDYLRNYGLTPGYYPLPVSLSGQEYETKIAEVIDNGHQAILCLDMFYVKENPVPEERTNRFYAANSQGWGHFILVKGYRVIDGKMWLEVHDPYSIGQKYTNGQLKGDRRYYDPADLKKATDVWWPFALIVPQKNGVIQTRFRANESLVPVQKGRGVLR